MLIRHTRITASARKKPRVAVQRQALQQAQRHQDDGRQPADGRERGQQADREGRRAHDDDRDQEGVLAADQVADASEHQRAERPDQESRRVGRKAGEQRRRVISLGEKQRRKERRQRRVQIKVVPLEDRSERRSKDDPLLFGGESGGASGQTLSLSVDHRRPPGL
jgi:hypothetical protein